MAVSTTAGFCAAFVRSVTHWSHGRARNVGDLVSFSQLILAMMLVLGFFGRTT